MLASRECALAQVPADTPASGAAETWIGRLRTDDGASRVGHPLKARSSIHEKYFPCQLRRAVATMLHSCLRVPILASSTPDNDGIVIMAQAAQPRATDGAKGWTFLTNHAHVLLAIAREPTTRLRDVATAVGITERAAQAIVADLEAAGYLHRERVGRRNAYTINPTGAFRHPAEADHRIGELIDLFTDAPNP